MSSTLPLRPSTHDSSQERRSSPTRVPTAGSSSGKPATNGPQKQRSQASLGRPSAAGSPIPSRPQSVGSARSFQVPKGRLRSQYPSDSSELHVEFILVASFHVDRGPIMEHQYPSAISGDEHMLAELMLPDQTHVRSQDWTIFFLHKDTGTDEDPDDADLPFGEGRRRQGNDAEDDQFDTDDENAEEEDDAMVDEPPLMYVLNLVNTKQDTSVKRGAVVKAMAVCTRHSFLHIFKPVLLLALEDYFKSPFPETLASIYHSVNSMDLSLMPRLSYLERHILQATNAKDMFIEKFERMIQQRLEDEKAATAESGVDLGAEPINSRYSLPRDTHELESKIVYNDIAIPVKVPTAISPETVGDFSLIKLIQTFSGPHSATPQPFPIHAHLTTSGAYTHPIIVLVNALLTQKRVIFLGHNRPSSEVAEAVLAACSLVSGGILRGFTRHAFPYTDLTKVDELLKVPGFVAGVTNPAFANHPEWWDLLCDLPGGRMKISSRIEPAPVTEGMQNFQQQTISGGLSLLNSLSSPADPTGDNHFMDDILRSISSRHGEGAIRAKWRAYITKFTRISAAFEEAVYGASALYVIGPGEDMPSETALQKGGPTPSTLRGHGYVWPDEASKYRELGAWVSRIEGWRNTRSYYYFIQDTATLYLAGKPVQVIDIHHHHDRLRFLKLPHTEAAAVYTALSNSIKSYNAVCQLLSVAPESQAGLFYVAMGSFHPDAAVRDATVVLLERIADHEAGRHFFAQLSRFLKVAFLRAQQDKAARDSSRSSQQSGVSSTGLKRAQTNS